MKDQTFGIEIETTGIGREKTARAIAAHFGTNARHIGVHLDNWKVSMPDGREWTIERDSSVTDPSAEVVSPVCRWEDIPMVQEVVRAIRKAGAKADTSCGIHVHVGLGAHTPKTLRNLVNLVNAQEDALTYALQVSAYRRMEWCRAVEPEFLNQLNKRKPETMEKVARLWYRYSDVNRGTGRPNHPNDDFNWRNCANYHYNESRYHLLNLHATFSTERPARTIEFRAFNGTLHAGEIKSYIQLCLALSQKALESSSCSPTRTQTDNPAYTFRCVLLRLGFIGEEFKTARTHLLKHMPGNAAWRHGEPTARQQG